MLVESGLSARKERLAARDVHRPLYGFLDGRDWTS
jgi:hypothetical protein